MAPYVNSYRRHSLTEDRRPISPGAWTTARSACAFRSAIRRTGGSRTGSPVPTQTHLAMAASLAAIWLGLKEQRRPSRPRTVSGEDLTTLPRNLDIALDALERATPLHEVLGEQFVTLFMEVKRGEADAFLEVSSPWEREYLLLNV